MAIHSVIKKFACAFGLIHLTLFSLYAQAAQDIVVQAPYVKETIPGTVHSAAYMTLVNQSDKPVKLVRVSSAISDRIELHEHVMAGDTMKMMHVDSLDIPASGKVTLEPFGFHIMVFDVKRPLVSGENVVFTLYFDNQTNVEVNYPVQGIKNKHQHKHH